jgi:hypothetical protein
MRSLPLYFKGLIAALTLAILSTIVSGQDDRAKEDLGRSFRKFDLIRIRDSGPSLASGARRVGIRAAGRDLELVLTSNDLRSARYTSEDSARPGKLAKANGPVLTFKGSISGDSASAVRLSIDGVKVEGYFITGSERFFIEPAQKYSNLATDLDSVVYREKDSLIDDPLLCGADIPAQIENGKEIISQGPAQLITTSRLLEVATDADYEYVTLSVGPLRQTTRSLAF